MFMGEYGHSLDSKGRLIIPSKFREALGERFVITRSLDPCLCIYAMEDWEKFVSLTMSRNRGSLCASSYPGPTKWSRTSRGAF